MFHPLNPIVMGRFLYHESQEKHKTRKYVLEQIPALKKRKPKLLTLPADNFIFEQMVLSRYYHADIDCMEIDPDVYSRVKDNLPCNVRYEQGDVFDKLHDNPGKYDVIWLDLCGNLSTTTMNNLMSAVQTSIKPNSVFAFTLSSKREQRSKDFLKLYKCKDLNHFRFKVFPSKLTQMARMFHPHFKLKDILKYTHEGTNSSMSLYLFTNS